MRSTLSTLLLIAAAALLAAAGYLYYQDRQESDDLPPPPSVPGQAELKNVFDAVDAQDVDVEYGRGSARIEGSSAVGQELIVEDQPLYVFLYQNPDARLADTESLDLDNLTLTDSFGEPLEAANTRVFVGSNVMAVLTDGSDDLGEHIDAAIASIP